MGTTSGVTANGSVALNTAAGTTLTLDADVDAGAGAATSNAATIAVASSNASIQDAVDLAASGATVSVDTGTYAEAVSIGKPLNLIATGVQVTEVPATPARLRAKLREHEHG